MALKFSTPGLIDVLQEYKATLNTLTLRLYKNDYTPDEDSISADFTEANFAGYSAQATDNWGDAEEGDGAYAQIEEEAHLFVTTGATAGNSIYGYWLTDAGDNNVYAERFQAGPYDMSLANLALLVTPRVELRNYTPA